MKKIDLHIHTIFSDGTLTPEEVLTSAKKYNLSAISITDHDEIEGAIKAIKIKSSLPSIDADKYNVEIIPGVEISTQKKNHNIHILGYFIDFNNRKLLNLIDFARKSRKERIKIFVDKFNKGGINISLDEIKDESGPGVMGRLHIAEVLIKKGYAKTKEEAMAKYLRQNSPFFVPGNYKESKLVIETILDAGGIPVIAHPRISNIEEFIKELCDEGLRGIEVWYPTHSSSDIKKYLELAKKYNLVATGGSDSHGKREGYPNLGEYTVNYEILDALRNIRSSKFY